ncbi:hypothetical protein BH20ACI4_BH20ACI4_31680 [soil metagenome]
MRAADKINSSIGAGGMGEIYLARDTRLKRDVAIKILPEKLLKDNSAVERFMREAHAASALNHPNILTIYDIGKFEKIRFIATEYVEGETIRECLKSKNLTVKETLDIVIQISNALEAAHQAGIVHRDIKPENIMLRADGYVKILDFGIAKLLEREPPSADADAATLVYTATNPGMIIGTTSYLGLAYALAGKHKEAVEVLENLREFSKNSYIPAYSFAMLYLGLKDFDKTFEYLEKAFAERSGFLPFLKVEPMVDALRTDARFQDLLWRIDLVK